MKDLRFWTLVADFRFFVFAPGPRNWNSAPSVQNRRSATRVQSRKSAIGVQNRPLVSKWVSSVENWKSATSAQTRKSATRVQNWKPVPVSKIENRPLGFKFIFRFWIQVANLQFSILYTCDWWQVIKNTCFIPPPASSLCFAEKTIYTQEVLAVVLHQLMEMNPLPTLFMRTVNFFLTI